MKDLSLAEYSDRQTDGQTLFNNIENSIWYFVKGYKYKAY